MTPLPPPPPDENDDILALFLRSRSTPCPVCAYDLRGLTSTRCPECNQELVLKVGAAQARLAAFLGAVIGLATGAGFSGLLVCYLILDAIKHHGRVFDTKFLAVTGVGMVVESIALAALVRARPRFTRASTRVRALVVAASWLLTLTNLGVFSATIR